MYKVFFNDRTVFFVDDFHRYISNNTGLFYKYQNPGGLRELIDVYYDLEEVKNFYLCHHDIQHLWSQFVSSFRRINAGGGVVKNKDGKILVIRRKGKWDLPKGKADNDESIEETALREVEEECGIEELTNGKRITETWHTYKIEGEKILKRTVWFEMKYHGNKEATPQEEEGITEVRWLKPSEIGCIYEETYASIIDVLAEAGLKH
jgi:8-oxo-dGTP pyrophosphatase MutT (NUDIX family)